MSNVLDDKYADGNIPEPCQYIQAMLDRFVAISYDTTYDALASYSQLNDTDYLRQRIISILQNNPPLATVPKYLRDSRENFLWYSNFYDDAGKEVFKAYKQFATTLPKITPANYAAELEKVDLPYFKELVNLISLGKLYQEAERRLAAAAKKTAPEEAAQIDIIEQTTEEIPQPEQPAEKLKSRRSYEPRLNKEQYSLLAQCIEKIKLFRRPVNVAELKRLLTGKLDNPLQVANQPSFVCLFDKMMNGGYIKAEWIAVAVDNRDFISFRRGKNIDRYGSEPHYLTMGQLTSRRDDNKYKYADGQDDIEDMIKKMQEYSDR